jgi:hypothetical protein
MTTFKKLWATTADRFYANNDMVGQPTRPCGFVIGNAVMFTNECGIEFGPYQVIGFAKPEDEFNGRFIHISTDSPWFPVAPESLTLVETETEPEPEPVEIGTTIHTNDGSYRFPHIQRLHNIHAKYVVLAFVDDFLHQTHVVETWEIDNNHRINAVAQVAAYYKLIGVPCKWIIIADNSGYQNPTTPYADQDHELYRIP